MGAGRGGEPRPPPRPGVPHFKFSRPPPPLPAASPLARSPASGDALDSAVVPAVVTARRAALVVE